MLNDWHKMADTLNNQIAKHKNDWRNHKNDQRNLKNIWQNKKITESL
jgi:hypothetical protein